MTTIDDKLIHDLDNFIPNSEGARGLMLAELVPRAKDNGYRILWQNYLDGRNVSAEEVAKEGVFWANKLGHFEDCGKMIKLLSTHGLLLGLTSTLTAGALVVASGGEDKFLNFVSIAMLAVGVGSFRKAYSGMKVGKKVYALAERLDYSKNKKFWDDSVRAVREDEKTIAEARKMVVYNS